MEKVISFVFLVPSSMLSTVSALAAQNAGAGKDRRAVQTLRYAVTLCLGFGLAVGVAVQFLAGNIVALFDPTPAVVEAGSQYIRGYIWDLHVCGGPLQLQRVLLRLRPVGAVLFAQRFVHRAGAHPGGVSDVPMVPGDAAAMGCAAAAGSCLSVVVCVAAFAWLRRQESRPGAAA